MFIDKDKSTDKYLNHLVEENKYLILIKPYRILLRYDHKTLHNEVKILSGGPSSLAPLHSGLIGPGMLTGAVLGDIHNNPSYYSVLALLREAGQGHKPGVLMIAMNGPAERLVFILASQQAANEGIKNKCVIVGDDVSGVQVDRMTSRRGHCGVLFLQKIAGGMARENGTLEEIYSALMKIKGKHLGTVNWWQREDKMVVGPGLRGIDCIGITFEIRSLAQVVAESLAFLFNPSYEYSLDMAKGDKIAVIINNLGLIPEFQFSILKGEIKNQLQNMGVDVVRIYCGNFLSVDCYGVSLSILKVDKFILKLLDSWTSVVKWPGAVQDSRESYLTYKERVVDCVEEIKIFDTNNIGPMFRSDEAFLVVNILRRVVDSLEDNIALLNELDDDHDYGTSLKTFLKALTTEMNLKTLVIITAFGLLNNLAELAASSMGGVAGPMWGILLSGAAQGFIKHFTSSRVSWTMWVDAADKALEALKAHTTVLAQDRTLLAALHPFVDTFKKDSLECLGRAVEATKCGVEHTRTSDLQGRQDPGALSLYIVLHTILLELTLKSGSNSPLNNLE